MQPDEREILYGQGYMRGWLAARRAAREAMTDYEAKAALARVLAEANGRHRAEVRVELDDLPAVCPKCGGEAVNDGKYTSCLDSACGLVV